MSAPTDCFRVQFSGSRRIDGRHDFPLKLVRVSQETRAKNRDLGLALILVESQLHDFWCCGSLQVRVSGPQFPWPAAGIIVAPH